MFAGINNVCDELMFKTITTNMKVGNKTLDDIVLQWPDIDVLLTSDVAVKYTIILTFSLS